MLKKPYSVRAFGYETRRCPRRSRKPRQRPFFYTPAGGYFDLLLGARLCCTGNTRFPISDATGHSHGIVDQNGTLQEHYDFSAFGVPKADTTPTLQPFRYGGAWGYQSHVNTGLMQLGARWYWPEVGRFVQQDLIGDG